MTKFIPKSWPRCRARNWLCLKNGLLKAALILLISGLWISIGRESKPFEHHWQDYRTRKDWSLKTVSDFGVCQVSQKGKYLACVKVIDVFGCDSSITIEIEV